MKCQDGEGMQRGTEGGGTYQPTIEGQPSGAMSTCVRLGTVGMRAGKNNLQCM